MSPSSQKPYVTQTSDQETEPANGSPNYMPETILSAIALLLVSVTSLVILASDASARLAGS